MTHPFFQSHFASILWIGGIWGICSVWLVSFLFERSFRRVRSYVVIAPCCAWDSKDWAAETRRKEKSMHSEQRTSRWGMSFQPGCHSDSIELFCIIPVLTGMGCALVLIINKNQHSNIHLYLEGINCKARIFRMWKNRPISCKAHAQIIPKGDLSSLSFALGLHKVPSFPVSIIPDFVWPLNDLNFKVDIPKVLQFCSCPYLHPHSIFIQLSQPHSGKNNSIK